MRGRLALLKLSRNRIDIDGGFRMQCFGSATRPRVAFGKNFGSFIPLDLYETVSIDESFH